MENIMQSHRGFVSGFIGVGIHMRIQHILQHIHIASRCKEELGNLKDLVMRIELIVTHIQQNRLAFKSNKDKGEASAVNEWLEKLDGDLLLQSSILVQRCSRPKSRVNLSCCQPRKEINCLIKDITEHLNSSPLLVRISERPAGDIQKVIEGLGQIRDSVETLASCATTSQAAFDPKGIARKNLTKEPLIVGQEQSPTNMKKMKNMIEEPLIVGREEALANQEQSLANMKKMKNLIEEPLVGQEEAHANPRKRRKNLIEEPLIVGQAEALANLTRFVIDDVQAKKIGVLGKCGSGKTLLLKTLFNSQQVRDFFCDGLLLWLSLSQRHSVTGLINDLCEQIKKDKKFLNKTITGEKKAWLKQQLQDSIGVMLVLDDVWGRKAEELLEELGIMRPVSGHSNYKVIFSSRDRTALLKMGFADEYIIEVQDLTEDESRQLFKHHASGNPPPLPEIPQIPPVNIEKMAKLVFKKCKGVPLGIKMVGRAMRSSTDPQQWKWAIDRLQNGRSLDDWLRLSYDALGKEDFNLQLCFLLIAAAFLQDEIIDVQEVIPLWMGEGLLARQMLQNAPPHTLADNRLIEPMIRNTEGRPVCLRMQDPFEIGRQYVKFLADRCLIEPVVKDADGLVICFRMLDVQRDLAIRIANHEEYFSCLLGNGLKDFPKNGPSKHKRIFLSRNKLSSFPQFTPYSSTQMCSLLISQNTQLTKIPKKVIGSLLFLKVLDLSGTLVPSLPENVGCLKQLICLKLSGMPIKRLPKSLMDLVYLEILDVSFTNIKELPSDIDMLRSLRYLSLRGCKELQNLPSSISGLLSLQYLYMDGCSMWSGNPTWNRLKKVASLKSLGNLIQLKELALENNWEALSEGTLGGMTELDSLLLVLPKMESLPIEISNMSKLRRLSCRCSKLTEMNPFICLSLTETDAKMKNDVTNLKDLSYLKFYECFMLKEFQHLHKLHNLRQLEIILCSNVKKIPKEFGEKEAFPSLEKLSLVGLHNLEELPEIEKGAMPLLQIFTIMDCPKWKRLPNTYLDLKNKPRVYDRQEAMVGRENMDGAQVVTTSMNAEEIIEKYLQTSQKKEDWLYDEFCCNELFVFMEGVMM